MRNENGPNGLDLLVGLIVVGAFATAKTWARLQVSIGRIGEAIGHFLFILVKVGAVAALICGVCYGSYRIVCWVARFLHRVDALEGRVAEIGQKELPELSGGIDRLLRTLWGIKVEFGELRKQVTGLEEEAKKTKDTSAATIGAVVSEIAKG